MPDKPDPVFAEARLLAEQRPLRLAFLAGQTHQQWEALRAKIGRRAPTLREKRELAQLEEHGRETMARAGLEMEWPQ